MLRDCNSDLLYSGDLVATEIYCVECRKILFRRFLVDRSFVVSMYVCPHCSKNSVTEYRFSYFSDSGDIPIFDEEHD